jgi:hypothetical protein
MAIKATVVTVAATATALTYAENDWTPGASYLISVPAAGQTVFVGGPDVTAATGYPYFAGTEHPVALDAPGPVSGPAREVLYGIVASATQAVNVLAQGI